MSARDWDRPSHRSFWIFLDLVEEAVQLVRGDGAAHERQGILLPAAVVRFSADSHEETEITAGRSSLSLSGESI
jgi:hypothetical protein